MTSQKAETESAELRARIQNLEVENRLLKEELRKGGGGLNVMSLDGRQVVRAEHDGTLQSELSSFEAEHARRTSSRADKATTPNPRYENSTPPRAKASPTPEELAYRRDFEESEGSMEQISENVESPSRSANEEVGETDDQGRTAE